MSLTNQVTEVTVFLAEDKRSKDLGDRGVSILAHDGQEMQLQILVHDDAFWERYTFKEVIDLLSEDAKATLRNTLEFGSKQTWYAPLYRALRGIQQLSNKVEDERAIIQIVHSYVRSKLPDDGRITMAIMEELVK